MATSSVLQRQYKAARDKSVPLVVLRTVDPSACVRAIEPVTVFGDDDRAAGLVQWTCTTGFEAVNTPAQAIVRQLGNGILNPAEALLKAQAVPAGTAVVYQNLSDFWQEPRVRQGYWNLRDTFKANFRMAIAMGAETAVPRNMEHDVLVLDDPLPGSQELSEIVRAQYLAARLRVMPTDDEVKRAVDAVAGLSAFAAEQAVALSIGARGVNFDALRERHRQMIENTKGLSVWRGGETFEQVGGLSAFTAFMRRFLSARRYVPGSILFIDEVEKMFAGVKGDLNGIAQWTLGAMLSYMQDLRVTGILLMGHPGTGKSLLAKATGGEAGVPTIRFDSGAMQGSLVGQSQEALLHALKVTTAVSQGRPLVLATCNSVSVLPAELVNRFKFRFFVDLPSRQEKDVIWPIHVDRLKLDAKQPRPDDTEWNGREIDQCCETAYMLNCSLLEAAEMVVPIAQSSAEEIERRRREAAGRYLSASYPGAFAYERKEVVQVGARQIRVEDDRTAWVAPGSNKAS
jgi:hypothetical protein